MINLGMMHWIGRVLATLDCLVLLTVSWIALYIHSREVASPSVKVSSSYKVRNLDRIGRELVAPFAK